MGIIDKLKEFFKKNKSTIKNNIQEENKQVIDELIFTGDEHICSACGEPIHESQKKSKIGKKYKYHRWCYRFITKIALSGQNPEKVLEKLLLGSKERSKL